MEQAIKIFIIIHAGFGGIAFVAGLIAMISKKGQRTHRKTGLIFFYSMVISAVSAMFISVLPNHESPFLFAVGLFSLYFVLIGKRAMRFKHKNPNLIFDKWMAWVMILTGILMIFLPIVLTQKFNIVLGVFAVVGILSAIKNLRLYKNPEKLRKGWLKMHLGNIMGGYIAAVTAFVVVNQIFPSFYGWFIPGIIGGLFIIFWMKRVENNSVVKVVAKEDK
ncbi:DUF2306 domain-containing protein [Brumimicrobium glaciale]|uniref:DUF2306 domain-containing protein n=1 Tax=Brumimicrobium glaciale TaxID=200475 RepID=A0A4Q4KLN1_9FLAO|nr:DUF2306 domain-containing protein [Brumimicrobium glaciale]RYM34205.1 DUF2306 domain-containing protein [Brumimicrobium glaciale]